MMTFRTKMQYISRYQHHRNSLKMFAYPTGLNPHPPPVPKWAGGGEREDYISPPTLKIKSPSQLRQQERRQQESISQLKMFLHP